MIRGVIAGIVAGLVLGIMLKGMEKATGIPVYTLLLNVDFIPYFRTQPLSEAREFLLHMLVSILMGMVYFYIVTTKKITSFKSAFHFAFFLTLPGILLYFPLCILAVNRVVPEPYDLSAIGLWVFSHLGYCLTLMLFIRKDTLYSTENKAKPGNVKYS